MGGMGARRRLLINRATGSAVILPLAALQIVEDGICQLVQAFALWTHTSRPFEITCAAGRSRFEFTRQGATLHPSHSLGILPVQRSQAVFGSTHRM